MALSTVALSGVLAIAAGTAAIGTHWIRADSPPARAPSAAMALQPECEPDLLTVAMNIAATPPATTSLFCGEALVTGSSRADSWKSLEAAFPR